MLLDETFIKNSKQFTSLNKNGFASMTLMTMRIWKLFSKKFKIIKVKVKNKKKKLSLNQQERELEVKVPLNKALEPLKVNLLGLDTCLIA